MPELMYYLSEIRPAEAAVCGDAKPVQADHKLCHEGYGTGAIVSGIQRSQFSPRIFRDHPVLSGKPTRTPDTLETLKE